jgi:hypothetical protein
MDLYEKYLKPHGLDIPGYMLKPLVEAINATASERVILLEKARQKAELHYLGSWARGLIKVRTKNHKPMSEDTKQYLKELNEARREERKAKSSEHTHVNVQKKVKVPVFQDTDKQKEIKSKYPWVIEGTFRQDPHKAGRTCVDIKCQKCGTPRTIHLADAFQVKLCTKCRGIDDAK